jgi:hypothetical protein
MNTLFVVSITDMIQRRASIQFFLTEQKGGAAIEGITLEFWY